MNGSPNFPPRASGLRAFGSRLADCLASFASVY